MEQPERIYQGIPVSPGITIGRAFIVDRFGASATEVRHLSDEEVEEEVRRFERAVQISRDQLAKIRQQVAEALDEKHADIFAAQAAFLDDDELIGKTIEAIRTEKKNAEYLFNRRVSELLALINNFEDEFFKARNSDVLDIANRVTNNLSNKRSEPSLIYPPDSVLVATDLAPSETTVLTHQQVTGLVLEKGGPTSHTAIMAKALEIPCVVGVSGVVAQASQGARIIVDGINGRIVVYPRPETLTYYMGEQSRLAEIEAELALLRDEPAETLDGYSIELRANVELIEEVSHLASHGAQGIGLFRTEFLFMNRSTPPTEEEQFEIYREVVQAVAPHSVVFRTLDFGGDKLAAGEVARELNPFMGQRAIRLCFSQPELFHQQLRAMLRASAYGKARILIPMISGVEEFLEVKRHIRHCKAELKLQKIPFDRRIKVGAMIEVPSAAIVADDLARVCDFFSIGTNDLIQYTLAVDRSNERVAYLYEPLHPAILKLLKTIIAAARKGGIPVTVCGEVAADPMMAVVLLGMGVDELSMSAVNIPQVKKLVRSITLSEAKSLVEDIVTQQTIDGIKKVVRRHLKSYVKANKTRGSQLLRESAETVRI